MKVTCLAKLADEDERLLDVAERMGLINQKDVRLDGAMGWVDLLRRAQESKSKNNSQ